MPAPIIYSTVSIAPPPPNWSGDARALFALLAQNLQVRNPAGYNTFTVGSAAPATDSGPWLKDGREWYVWDLATNAYIPQRLAGAFGSASGIPIVTSLTDAKVVNGTDSGFCGLTYTGVTGVQVFVRQGGQWVPFGGTLSGTTANRPASAPPLTKYYDTTIKAELYMLAGFGWVTVAGAYGDVKAVTFSTEADALTYNPGWEILSMVKGRVIAGHDGSVNGYTDRAPLAGSDGSIGEEFHVLTEAEMAEHRHYEFVSGGQGYRTPLITGTQAPVVYSYSADGETQDYVMQQKGTTPDVEADVGGTSLTGDNSPHNNLQPTLYLIHLRKAH